MASTSATPSERAAAATCPKIASQRARVSSASLICAADPDFSEPRRARAMAGSHHLLGLSLAAVGRAPQRPVFRPGNRRAGIPELGADAAVAGIFQHADA